MSSNKFVLTLIRRCRAYIVALGGDASVLEIIERLLRTYPYIDEKYLYTILGVEGSEAENAE